MFNQYAQWEAEQQLETWTAAEWQHHQWEEQQQQASPPVQQQLQQQQEQQQEQQEVKHEFSFFTASNPTVGWPSSSIMTVLASASTSISSSSSASSSAPQIVAKASESGSVLNGALDDYAVLDSACSHRPVFKAVALFDRAPVVDSSVQMIDSNGNTTTAAGIGSATLRLNTVNPAGTVAIHFGEAVYNPECPVNLLSVANIIMDRGGKVRDNEVNFKKRLLILNGSDPATRKTVPIEYKYGLFVVRLAMLVAAVDNKQE